MSGAVKGTRRYILIERMNRGHIDTTVLESSPVYGFSFRGLLSFPSGNGDVFLPPLPARRNGISAIVAAAEFRAELIRYWSETVRCSRTRRVIDLTPYRASTSSIEILET